MLKFLKQIIQWIAGTGFTGALMSGNSANEDWRSWVDYKHANPDSNIQDWWNDSYGSTSNDRASSGIATYHGSSGITGLGAFLGALTNRITGRELTGAEQQQNAWNAGQAQIDRDFQERMASTQYQRAVADMRAAGVNPALAMSNGGAAAPSGSTAAGVQPQGQALNFSDLMQLMMLKPQIRLMEKQGQAVEDQGKAALATSEANTKNAETNRRSQIVDALLANNQIKIGDSIRQLNEAQMEEIAQRIRESASRMELQAVEKLAKELQYEFDSQTFEANKELVLQQLVYRAIEMSELSSVIALNNELKKNASKQGEILDADKVGAQLSAKWKEDNPRFYKFLEAAGMSTGVIGNILSGSFGWSSSRSKSHSDVDVRSTSRSVSDVTTHKGD